MSEQEVEGSESGGDSGEEDSGARDVEEEEDAVEEGDVQDADVKGKGSPDSADENQEETPEETNDLQQRTEEKDEEKDAAPRRPSKDYKGMDKEEVKNLLRRLSNSEASEASGNGSGSSSSFGDSIGNRRSIRTLQSSVIRDHDLPMKIAYEQLEELAANADKVKYAIEKNRNLLNVQVKKSNSRYLRAAFTAWKLQFDWKKIKKRDLEWAKGRWKRTLMSRAFKVWSREHLVTSKVKRLEKNVKDILGRHLLRRRWKAWRAFTEAKVQEDDDRRRERRLVKDLDYRHQDKICRRACNFMYRRRLRRLFLGFRSPDVSTSTRDSQIVTEVEGEKDVFGLERRSFEDSGHSNISPESRRRRRSRSLQSVFTAWKSSWNNRRGYTGAGGSSADDFYQKHAKNVVALAFAAWQGAITHRKQGEEYLRRVSLSLDKQLLARAFDAFVDGCNVSKWMGTREKRASIKMNNWRLKKYFEAWICFMQVQAQKKMIRLQEHVVQVEKEIDRVRQDNQRLTHVIDSGDWGRKRVAELLQAGQILSGERDALTRLLGRMQRQHGFALNQQKVYEEEIQEMKNQILKNKPHMRNKLLVKGASSFNSLIRAMKEDVLKNGTDPGLLYTIDKLAMEEVTVFPDGDLHVKPMTNFDKGKGSWSSRHTSPSAQNNQVPTTPATDQTRRGQTPSRRRTRPQTPLQTSNTRQEAGSAPGTLVYARSKTPMRGRAFGRFDYTQMLDRTTEELAPPRVVSGERNVMAKGAGYSRDASPAT